MGAAIKVAIRCTCSVRCHSIADIGASVATDTHIGLLRVTDKALQQAKA